jgi:hypothetical protein
MEGYLPAAAQARQQGWEPVISMDNPNIHKVSPKLIDLSDQLLVLPKYSPDLHQLIEHPFGGIKHDVVVDVYKLGWDVVHGGMQLLRDEVAGLCRKITPQQVEDGIKGLVECYQVVAAERTGGVLINNTWVPGVQGNRPPKRFR